MDQVLSLIDRFGVVIVLIGTFFEGEVFAIIGGFLAYRGAHPIEMMLGLAFIGSFFGDLSIFLFSRYFSDSKFVVHWTKRPRFARALSLVDRYQAYFVIVNRYVYGLRMPGLIALGLSSITVPRFLVLNLIGAAIWASLFTTIGFVFGYSISSVFARLQMVEEGLIAVLLTLAAAAALWFVWSRWGPGAADRRAERERKRQEREERERKG